MDIITEFLEEATEAEDAKTDIRETVTSIVQFGSLVREKAALETVEVVVPVLVDITPRSVSEPVQERSRKKEMSKEERLRRDLFLQQYGYEIEESEEEEEPEVELKPWQKAKMPAKTDLLFKNTNAAEVREKEIAQRMAQSALHKAEKQRNQDNMKKQKQEKELKKKQKVTQKREKVRM